MFRRTYVLNATFGVSCIESLALQQLAIPARSILLWPRPNESLRIRKSASGAQEPVQVLHSSLKQSPNTTTAVQ